MPRSSPFDDPIKPPKGKHLATLQDAADYIMKLPKADQAATEWQTAIACLIGAAEGRTHAKEGSMKTVLIYVDTTAEIGNADHIKVLQMKPLPKMVRRKRRGRRGF